MAEEDDDVAISPEGIPRITVRPPSGIVIPPPPPGFTLVGDQPPSPPPGFTPIPSAPGSDFEFPQLLPRARPPATPVPPGERAPENELPPTVEEFKKKFGRDPATDGEMEFYYPEGSPEGACIPAQPEMMSFGAPPGARICKPGEAPRSTAPSKRGGPGGSPVGRIAPFPFEAPAPPPGFELVTRKKPPIGPTPPTAPEPTAAAEPPAGAAAPPTAAAEPPASPPPAAAALTPPGQPAPTPTPPAAAPGAKPPSSFARYFWQAMEPITSYLPTQRKMAKEGMEQVGRGVRQLGTPGERLTGAANVGLGALEYVTSPIGAGLRTIAGIPIERATGLPKEYTEFTLGLAIPGLGLPRLPGAASKLGKFTASFSPTAEDAAALIRQETGAATRATEQTGAAIEAFYKPVEQLPQADKWNLMNYIDGGTTAVTPPTAQLRAFSDTLKDAFKARKAQLQSLPKYAQREFLEDYFPHFWQDPNSAKQLVHSRAGGGFGPLGSGASLTSRTIPTFEEGVAAGLKPLYDNPIDATMRYIMSIDKFIAANKILEEGVASGTVIKAKPKIIGASGRPQPVVGIPKGYVELAGRGGRGNFAPEGWARIYNNWVSRGFQQFQVAGPVYEGARRFTNAMTQSLLGFSGYHAFTMAEAGMSTELARAVKAARGFKAGEFAKAMGRYATTPIRYAYRGKKFKDMYLHPQMPIAPEDREVVDLLTEAGGRFVGTRHTLDYQASALGDYLTSFRRAQLRGQFSQQLQRMRQPGVLPKLGGVAGAALENIARTLETMNKPLFQHYIPSMKNGAAGELMSDWLKANPGAGKTEKLAAARRIVDSVDNRFGEMIQDNIFWNKMLKQTAVLSMLSYSWNMGALREIGGGIRDIARTAVGRGAWTPKSDYVVSTAINWSILSGMYQYAKTGKAPWDTDTPLRDLMAPRTGGTDARSGEPERIIVPGIMKDVFGYYEHPMQEIINKLNPGLKATYQLSQNADWRNDPIFAPRTKEEQTMWELMPEWLGNLFEHVGNTGLPITVQSVGKREPGTGLSFPEQALGIRTAPRFMMDPRYDEIIRRMKTRQWYGGYTFMPGKLGHEEAQQRQLQGLRGYPQRTPPRKKQRYEGPQ